MRDIDEVINALEGCALMRKPDCAKCYQQGPGLGFACREGLMKDALYLLRELKPEETRLVRHYIRPGVYADLWLHCEKCGGKTDDRYRPKYCPCCGRPVKWND